MHCGDFPWSHVKSFGKKNVVVMVDLGVNPKLVLEVSWSHVH